MRHPFAVFLFDPVEKSHHESDDEEAGAWEDEEHEGFEAEDVVPQDGAGSQEFADEPDDDHAEHEAESHADGIDKGIRDGFFACEGFEPHGDDGKGDDEFDEDAHLCVGGGEDGGKDEVDDGDPGGDDEGVGWDSDARMDLPLKEGDSEA